MTEASTYKAILNAISSGVFAIEPISAQTYYPTMRKFLGGDTNAFKNFYDDSDDENEYTTTSFQEEAVISVIKISGVILKNDGMCSTGTNSLAARIKALDADEKVSAILLRIDSPGGMADGTQNLAKAIKNCKKPTLALIDDGMACSAAYWIGSSADEFWASKSTDRVGSIGTMITIANFDKMYENEGVKIHDIYATKSTDKNKDFDEASNGNYKQMIIGLLDPINEEFLNDVKNARPNIKPECLTGKVFMAQNAIQLGLIDQIGEYAEAVIHLSKKVKGTKTSSKVNSNSAQSNLQSINSKPMNFLSNMFSTSKTEQEAANNIETALAENATLKTTNTTLTAENSSLLQRITALENEKTALTAANTTLAASNEVLTAENEKYSSIPGTTHTQPTVAAGTKETTSLDNVENEDFKVLNESAHAQEARRLLGK